ncbi:MAG TPA: hypothetical protein VGS11_12240 [Candidatus Bathyarchaeia archaeon]|nr:hypothetical protein [Candidatus Bathyarchaeia archaeon]
MTVTTVTTNGASVFDRPSTKVLVVAVFTSLSLATDYAMSGFQNIKMMDTLVFLSAFLFGFRPGIGVALLTRFVFGLVNPIGPADPITLLFIMTGECFFAIAGAMLRRTVAVSSFPRGSRDYGRLSLVLSSVGLLATFAFDILTNFGSWLFETNSLYQALLIGNIVGAPFSIAHEASNVVFFATIAPAVVVAATRLGLRTPQ